MLFGNHDKMLKYDKNGLIPAIVQDAKTHKVLMLGFMNEESYSKTIETTKVTFYSRTRDELWTKGETSGNYLIVQEIKTDCDNDTLLIKAHPTGPVCHTGKDTCFNEINVNNLGFLTELESIIDDRKKNLPKNSYTTSLFKSGLKKIAQKVGEEATEVVIDAVKQDKERLLEESADLLFHLMVLLKHSDLQFGEVVQILQDRHK